MFSRDTADASKIYLKKNIGLVNNVSRNALNSYIIRYKRFYHRYFSLSLFSCIAFIFSISSVISRYAFVSSGRLSLLLYTRPPRVRIRISWKLFRCRVGMTTKRKRSRKCRASEERDPFATLYKLLDGYTHTARIDHRDSSLECLRIL